MSKWGGTRSASARAVIRARGRLQVCWRCGRALDLDADPWHAGHVVDRAAGGTDVPANLAAECVRCNTRAGGRVGAAMTNAKRTGKSARAGMASERDRGIRGI